ncbi:MAG: hypothetical protein KDD94_02820 [Calditrichaeota bacterium]|nr:hypothetical protein [Calditrichota bacterium]
MEFLYKLTAARPDMLNIGPTEAELQIIQEHTEYLSNLSTSGSIILYGRTQVNDERSFGLVIFKAATETEARKLMTNDPAVSKGIMNAELHPYKIEFLNRQYHD